MRCMFRVQAREVHESCSLPPILFIHGSGGFSCQWNSFQSQLFRTFGHELFGCYTIELPQQSRVSIAVEMFDAVALKVNSILQQTGHTRVSLVGHSMGGLVAAHFAHKHPGVVAAVVTIGSPWKGAPVLHYCRCCCNCTHRLEMRPDSLFLKHLNAHWSASRLHMPPLLCITGVFDVQVPQNRSYHSSSVVSKTLSSHLSLLMNPSVVRTTGMFLARLTNESQY